LIWGLNLTGPWEGNTPEHGGRSSVLTVNMWLMQPWKERKWFVVVDQMEGKCYDGIVTGTRVFSPDSQRVAYGARTANRLSVVVDSKGGKRYAGMGVGSQD